MGLFDPAEARAVRGHLAHCPDCRRQLDELVEVKDVLDQVPLESMLDASPDGGEGGGFVPGKHTEPPCR
jgi:anti-sigma factor RsiW